MAEDKGTSTPEQPKEATRGIHIPRVVVVVLLASLIASCIVLFFFAKDVAAFFIAGRDVDKRAVLWGIRTVAVLVVMGALCLLIRIGYDYQWTGLGQAELHKPNDVELRPKKTLWDWLQLLIVPIVLSLITVAFTWQQDVRQQEAEERRAKVDRQIEEHRADDAALQAYFNKMNTLMLEKNLRSSTENNATEDSKAARILARAQTLTVLARLDSERKTQVMQFLVEAELIQSKERETEPIIELQGADLKGVDLSNAYLRGVDLREADLREANLYNAQVSVYAYLSDANLSGANLREANLYGTDMPLADLSGAQLNGADLTYADLGFATGITNEELKQQAFSLKGATMPNGQKYEDWLKSKESGG